MTIMRDPCRVIVYIHHVQATYTVWRCATVWARMDRTLTDPYYSADVAVVWLYNTNDIVGRPTTPFRSGRGCVRA